MKSSLVVMVVSVATLHYALSASLDGAEEKEKATPYDGLVELLKVDQMEFDAAQKEEVAQLNEPVQFEAAQKEDVLIVNVTVDDGEDTRYLEAGKSECVEGHQGPADVNTGEYSEAAMARDETQSRSTEKTEAETVTESASSSDEQE